MTGSDAVVRAKRMLAIVMLTAIGAVALATQARASIQLGEKFTKPGDAGFAGTMLQNYNPTPNNNEYKNITGVAGVITKWSTFGTTASRTLKLKVGSLSEVSGIGVSMAAESPPQVVVGETTHEFAVRIPIRPLAQIGLYSSDAGVGTLQAAPANNSIVTKPGDILPATTLDSVGWKEEHPFRINVAATMEPDADLDGWGDETQDKCAGKKGELEGCPPVVPTKPTKPKRDPKAEKEKAKEERDKSRGKGDDDRGGSAGKAAGKCKKGFKKVTVKPKGKKGKPKTKCKRIKKGKGKGKGR